MDLTNSWGGQGATDAERDRRVKRDFHESSERGARLALGILAVAAAGLLCAAPAGAAEFHPFKYSIDGTGTTPASSPASKTSRCISPPARSTSSTGITTRSTSSTPTATPSPSRRRANRRWISSKPVRASRTTNTEEPASRSTAREPPTTERFMRLVKVKGVSARSTLRANSSGGSTIRKIRKSEEPAERPRIPGEAVGGGRLALPVHRNRRARRRW